MRPYVPIAALLAALAGTISAHADVQPRLPRATCALATRGDGTEQQGVLNGGPWTEWGAGVSVRCTIRAVAGTSRVEVWSSESPEQANVGVLVATPVSYGMPFGPMTNFEVCTEVTIHRNGTYDIQRYDADNDPSNGAQCAPAQGASSGDVKVFAVPPSFAGDPCVAEWDDLRPPPVDGEVGACVPFGSLPTPSP